MRLVLRIVFLLSVFSSAASYAADNVSTYSLQAVAFTPNAGGQKAYSLRRLRGNQEWSLFANTYLMAGGQPLVGVSWDYRFSTCERCVWQFYTQVGVGLSTGGPLVEVIWGTIFLWTARLDFATQMFATYKRAVVWSYPLWAGVSFSI